MRVEITHEGVTWSPRPAALSAAVAGTFGGAGATGLATGLAWLALPGGPWLAVGLACGGAAAAALVAHSLRRDTILLRPDRLVVERRQGLARERFELRFVDLQAIKVIEHREDYAGHSLFVRAGDHRLTLGAGTGEAHLRWFEQAVHDALDRFGERERREGREFFFHRERPDELEQMLGR